MTDIKQKALGLKAYYPKEGVGVRLSWAFNKYQENGLVYLQFAGSGVDTTVDLCEEDAVALAEFILKHLKKEAPKGVVSGAF